LRSSSISKISTSSCKSELKKLVCHITADSGPSSRCIQFPFSKDILEYKFPKKFIILTFGFYSSQRDSVQHLRQYQDKMVIHSRNDSILCRIFPFGLRVAASDWFYSLSLRSVHDIRDLTKLFLAQYSSCQEFKHNNHHLLSIMMRASNSLKA